jgi:hypothetical protein
MAYKDKEQQKEYMKRYYEERKEEMKGKSKKHREEYKEECRERDNKYYQEHKEEIAIRKKLYDEEHKEEKTEYNKQYWENNKPILIEKNKKWREENPDKIHEWNEKYFSDEENVEHRKEYLKSWRIRNKDTYAIKRRIAHREHKIKMLEEIAKFHNSEIKCWRCGEERIWVLTVGHPSGNGDSDRKNNGTGTQYYRNIIAGNVDLTDVKIECMNCNCCSEWYGLYPDEMTIEKFTNGS